MDGQINRSNDEQCKVGIDGSECLSEYKKKTFKRKKRRAARNRIKYENKKAKMLVREKPECSLSECVGLCDD